MAAGSGSGGVAAVPVETSADRIKRFAEAGYESALTPPPAAPPQRWMPPFPEAKSDVQPADSQESKDSQADVKEVAREAASNEITVKLHAIIQSEGNALHILFDLIRRHPSKVCILVDSHMLLMCSIHGEAEQKWP